MYPINPMLPGGTVPGTDTLLYVYAVLEIRVVPYNETNDKFQICHLLISLNLTEL